MPRAQHNNREAGDKVTSLLRKSPSFLLSVLTAFKKKEEKKKSFVLLLFQHDAQTLYLEVMHLRQ